MTIPERRCEKCKYFHQHYVKTGSKYSKAFCGHCHFPRLKPRQPTHKSCDNYIEKPL